MEPTPTLRTKKYCVFLILNNHTQIGRAGIDILHTVGCNPYTNSLWNHVNETQNYISKYAKILIRKITKLGRHIGLFDAKIRKSKNPILLYLYRDSLTRVFFHQIWQALHL